MCGSIKIDQISVEICEDGNCSIFFYRWLTDDTNSFQLQVLIVSHKIVCMQEQKYPSTGLVSDSAFLFLRNRFRQ